EHARNQRFMDPAQRGENIGEMYEVLAGIIATRSTAEWTQLLQSADIPMAPVAGLDDLLEDEHLKATGFFEVHEHPTEGPIRMPGVPVRFSRTPGGIRWAAPNLNQDADDIRAEAGMGDKK